MNGSKLISPQYLRLNLKTAQQSISAVVPVIAKILEKLVVQRFIRKSSPINVLIEGGVNCMNSSF